MPSFDVVSRVDMQEVRNAVDQAQREISTRFDFKNTGSTVELGENSITVRSDTEARLKAAVEVLEEKFIKRKLSLKALSRGKVEEAGGGTYRQTLTITTGIATEKAKEIVKAIKDTKMKVQAAIQGDEVRITGKKRDDLQEVIQHLKDADYDIPLQYVNFRD